MDDKLEALRRYFGYIEFRGAQEPLIDAQLAGRDAFGVMPTGGGKSLCYQLPTVLLPGITLVVSPLISLMLASAPPISTVPCPRSSSGWYTGTSGRGGIKLCMWRRSGCWARAF